MASPTRPAMEQGGQGECGRNNTGVCDYVGPQVCVWRGREGMA